MRHSSRCVSGRTHLHLEKVKGNKVLVTTSTAQADCRVGSRGRTRADPTSSRTRARHLDAMEELKCRMRIQGPSCAPVPRFPKATRLVCGLRALDELRENRDFFLNRTTPPTSSVVDHGLLLYKTINASRADAVRSGDGLHLHSELGAEQKYASQKNEYDVHFAPASAGTVAGEKDEIFTKTVVIHFAPNSWDLNKKISRTTGGKEVEELYDPNVTFIVEEVGKLAGQFGAARIVIEGHSDGSMRAQVPKSLVQELSLNRANAVKEAIVRKFSSLQPNPFSAAGIGGTGRPIRRIRRTTRRTGAWKSKCTRRRRPRPPSKGPVKP